MKIVSLVLVTSLLLFAEDNTTQSFEDINVQTREQKSVFAPQDYLQTQTYVEQAPSQRRLSIVEAMNIPGVQGDPIKAIKVLSGVTSAGSLGEIIVHASKSTETVNTINQLPVGYLFHVQGLHSVISPEATDQLDLYLSAYDVTYNNAMGGVLDITPKYPMGDNSGFIHVGLFDASFGFDGSLGEKTSFYVGGRRSYFDLLLPSFSPPKAQDDLNRSVSVNITQFPQYWDTTLLVSHVEGNHQFSLETLISQDSLGVILDGNVKDPDANGAINSDQGFISSGLRWLYDNQENYQANSLLYYMKKYSATDLFNNGLKVNIDNHQLGFKHISTLSLGKHKLSAGFVADKFVVPLDLNITRQPRADDVNYTLTGQTAYTIKETLDYTLYSLFAQDVYTITDWMKLRYGVLYATSTITTLQNQVDPRMALIFSLGEKDTLAFSGGQYSQTPNGTRNVQKIGNPDLTFERSYHATIKYKHEFDEGHYVEVEPFYKIFRDLIVNDTTNTVSKNFLNGGKGVGLGLDFTYKYVDDNWYVLAAYSYVDSTRQIDSADATQYTFYQEIPNTLNVITSYKLNDAWSFSALLKFQNGAPYTPVTGTVDNNGTKYPVYGTAYSARLDDYLSLNLKASYVQKIDRTQQIEYSFEVLNATNHQNALSISYSDDYSKKKINYDLPLIPWFDVTYRF